MHAVQTRRLAGAGLVDQHRRHPALGQPGRRTDAVFHFLGGFHPVDLHQDGSRAVHASGAHIEAADLPVAVKNLDAFAVLAGRNQPAAGLVLFGQRARLVDHAGPGSAKRVGLGGIPLHGHFRLRRAHLFDLTQADAHLDGQVDRQIPDVVGGEILEHGGSSLLMTTESLPSGHIFQKSILQIRAIIFLDTNPRRANKANP